MPLVFILFHAFMAFLVISNSSATTVATSHKIYPQRKRSTHEHSHDTAHHPAEPPLWRIPLAGKNVTHTLWYCKSSRWKIAHVVPWFTDSNKISHRFFNPTYLTYLGHRRCFKGSAPQKDWSCSIPETEPGCSDEHGQWQQWKWQFNSLVLDGAPQL